MTHTPATEQLLTTNDAARLLCLSPSRVRQLVDAGVLPATRTRTGMRLIHRRDVDRLAAERRGEEPAPSAEEGSL